MYKLRVAVIFGGRSAEHEVSLQSAKNVLSALNKEKYEPVLIGIDKSGRWFLIEDTNAFLNDDDPKHIALSRSTRQVAVVPGGDETKLIDISTNTSLGRIDAAFPILHGPFGEDGTVQGLLKLANIPFVGAGVLGSALGMDKDAMKRILRSENIPIADFLTYSFTDRDRISFSDVEAALGMPVFVKPANMGSSVGISKVSDKEELRKAVDDAFLYDTKIIIEEYIKGREIECSVLGNEDPIASIPGEILPRREFYSYEAKYIDENGAVLEIPAKLDQDVIERVRGLAVATYKALCCEGLARVDMFLKDNGEILINEINTLPGFTRISMYPKLWEISGLPYDRLLDRLIELARERYDRERSLVTTVEI